MWELDHKEGWKLKDWCFWTVMLEKTLESPLDCKEIKLVNPKGNQSRIFIRRTDAEAEAPILWSRDAKNWLIGKDSDAGNDWRREEKGMTEDEMVGWHHQLDGHEFEQALGVGDGQEAWQAAVHGIAKSRTQLRDWTDTNNDYLKLKILCTAKETCNKTKGNIQNGGRYLKMLYLIKCWYPKYIKNSYNSITRKNILNLHLHVNHNIMHNNPRYESNLSVQQQMNS